MWKQVARVLALALLVLVAVSVVGCRSARSAVSRMILGGEGELVTSILCPLVSDSGNLVAAVPERGTDQSLWHEIEVVVDPLLGCAVTESLLVEPGVVPLNKRQVPEWVPGDRVTLTIADAGNPRAPMPREEHRAFLRELAPASVAVGSEGVEVLAKKTRRVVVRANRRNNL